jgi:hypothetical protein
LTDDDNPNGIIELAPPRKYPVAPPVLLPTKPITHEGYGPGGNRSYFADLAAVADREARLRKGMEASQQIGGRIGELGEPWTPIVSGNVESALQRLGDARLDQKEASDLWYRRAERELAAGHVDWALDTTNIAALIPAAPFTFLGAEFALSARNKAVLGSLLRQGDLPPSGMVVQVARISTGLVTATAPTEGTTGTDSTAVTATASAPVVMIQGSVNVSRQLVDRADSSFDTAMAAELGASLGEQLDIAIFSAVLAQSGTSTTAYTSATPTVVALWTAYLNNLTAVAAAYGQTPDVTVMSPRRRFWLENYRTSTTIEFVPPKVPAGVQEIDAPTTPIALGAGTNQDVIVNLRQDQLPVFTSAPTISAYSDVLSGTLQVRYQARMYAAIVTGKQPASIGVVSGTGLANPGTLI